MRSSEGRPASTGTIERQRRSLTQDACQRFSKYLRALEAALSSRLLTLITFGQVWLALDLLLTAGQACLRKPLPRFPSLGDAPIRIDRDPIDSFGNMTPIRIDITDALALNVSLVHDMGQGRRAL